MREHLAGLVEVLSAREEPVADTSLEEIFREVTLAGPRASRPA